MKLAIIVFASLLVASQAALPTKFKNAGSPAEIRGAWAGPLPGGGVETGIQAVDGTLSYASVQGKKHEYTYGRVTSYECIGRGKFRAIIDYTIVGIDGKISKSRVCELGHVDLEAGIYRWTDSEKGCPKTLTYVLTRASPWQAPSAYSCK